MLDIKCRLCSSSCALISLFGGKSRQIRDYIRKMVEVTVGIKFEKDDLFKCICYPCTIQIYNFFMFKTKSIENEKALEAHIKKDDKKKSKKIEILNVDDIVLPGVSELQSNLAPWLLSKSNCEDQGTEKVSDQNRTELRESGDTIQNIDVSVQCRLPENMFHKSSQCDFSVFSCDKYIQCVMSNIAKTTQTNKIFTKSSETQCLVTDYQENSEIPRQHPVVTTPAKETNIVVKCCSSCEQNCQEKECKCHVGDLVVMKLESTLSTPRNHQNERVTSRKRKIFSPIANLSSPVFTNPPASRNAVTNENFNSTVSHNLFQQNLTQCDFCNKKFTSLRQTRRHIDNNCEIRKMIQKKPVVQLVRLENLNTLLLKYSQCLHLNDSKDKQKNEIRPGVRLRSRSTSSVESLYTLCSDSVTMLHDLKLGMDKSTQTNLLFDNENVPNLFKGEVILNVKPKRGRLAKKLKLSQ